MHLVAPCFCRHRLYATFRVISALTKPRQQIGTHRHQVSTSASHCLLADMLQYIFICGAGGSPLPPCPSLTLFYFSLSFIGFTYFLLLSIPSLSTRIVPLRFHAGGRRRRPNLGQFVFFCVFYLCYLYSLVKMHCGVSFYLVQCSFSALTLLVGSFDP